MKNMKKVISIMLTIAMVCSMASMVLAVSFDPEPVPPTGVDNITNRILGIISYVGYAVAFGMLLYIGIRYMMASAQDKADLKKSSINYVIGAVIVMFASTIFTAIKGLNQ